MGGFKREMVINYVPGEECRIAVLKDGKLDEFYSERKDQVSHVGNIYVGRVTNVEPAIQAAFVDFGLEQAGFLHTSDLHPRYFPGEDGETTERVGKKTPRRERPPIQDCLRRGDEVIVQVLKEGVGSKGPTVTSYLSIPGRYLVMMPGMDRVGVSRKVEDEELRAKMKAILDQLELPEGFGFIVRTAGLDRSKTELKRDLAYLLRLQKDMERRRKSGSKPRLLYSESDLLVRVLRDMMTAETDRVIIDSELAIKRASRFMKIVSPRTTTALVHYTGKAPIFHAMGVQSQIQTIYSREVPLPSGGRLVIDEAEALVAIDVNSGRHRDASDSETNALKTNLEAVDEIARQLRLRDLGGIVINDLIDMRAARHRREVEQKFEEIMKEDRARSTLLPITEFGILEMTRQRMRGSHESQHFQDCPTCHGRGLVQKAESVAADALRDLASLLAYPHVARAEMVIHPRVAGELLSSKRKALSRLEQTMGKGVQVRLSDAIPLDRVTFYAYEANGSDIEIDRLPRHRVSETDLVPFVDPDADKLELEDEPEEQFDFAEKEEVVEEEVHPIEIAPGADATPEGDNFTIPVDGRRGKKRRGRRGGRGRDGEREGPRDGGPRPPHAPVAQGTPPHADPSTAPIDPNAPREHPTLVIQGDGATADQPNGGAPLNGQPPVLGPDGQPVPGQPGEGGRRRRRRRRRGRGRGGEGGPGGGPAGQPGMGGPEGASGPADSSDGRESVASDGGGDVSRGDAAAESGSASAEPGAPHGHVPGGGGQAQDGGPGPNGQGPQGEGGRRRRRRRRGRGGGGGGGQGGGPGVGGGGAPPQRQRSDQPRPQGQGDGGRRNDQPRPQPTGPAPSGPPAQANRPRTLYAFNRKLKPGDRPSPRRDE